MARLAHYFLRDEASDGGAGGGTGSTSTATADPATATATTTDEAPDDAEQALGDAGKKALRAEREARKAAERRAQDAERERDDLRTATQSEQEKAINDAKKTAATEERSKWEGLIRRTRVESALTTAGCIDPSVASLAPDFADLKVTDTGTVEDMDSVIESFKKAHPSLFAAKAPGGSADQGVKPNDNKGKPKTLEESVMAEIEAQRSGRSA